MHYIMGGIKTDIDGLTNLEGVYAAGECANVSVHGGNRLGANSLLDTIVFGERAGNHAAAAARGRSFGEFNTTAAMLQESRRIQEMLDRPDNGDRWASIRQDMGESMNRNVAVFRNEEGIQETLGDLHELRRRYENVPVHNKGKSFNTDLVFALELGYMLDCADTIAAGAAGTAGKPGGAVSG